MEKVVFAVDESLEVSVVDKQDATSVVFRKDESTVILDTDKYIELVKTLSPILHLFHERHLDCSRRRSVKFVITSTFRVIVKDCMSDFVVILQDEHGSVVMSAAQWEEFLELYHPIMKAYFRRWHAQ